MLGTELLIQKIKSLPDKYAAKVLDFMGCLKEKAAKKQEPQYRGTQTDEPPLNAGNRAAIYRA